MIATNGKFPVAAYYRMSSDQQEKSIPEQRQEVEKYAAKHGYSIVREYIDEGISGDDTKRRKGFQKLIQDADQGEFRGVLCWDQSRFGRFDSLDASFWIFPLIQNGVTQLITVADGVIDWDSDSDRALFGIKQDFTNKKYLTDLSRNVLRGKLDRAKQGFLVGGHAPYGFDRIFVDEAGNERQRVQVGEQTAKPRQWNVTLAPSKDEEKVATVRWLFEQMATDTISARALATELNERGVPSPRGRLWKTPAIIKLLRHPVYCGDFVYGRVRTAKYHTVHKGELAKRTAELNAGHQESDEWLTVRNAFEGIVNRKLWNKAQKVLNSRQTGKPSPRKESYPLTGLVFCGHCGCRMVAFRQKQADKVYRYFKCTTYGTSGQCNSNCVRESALMDRVTCVLQEQALSEGNPERIRSEVKRLARSKSGDTATRQKALRKRINSLQTKLDRGTENLLLADPANVPAMQDRLSTWRDELLTARDALEAIESPVSVSADDAAKEAERAIAGLQRLREGLDSADHGLARELMRETVQRIDLYFTHEQRGQRTRCELSRGVIKFRFSFIPMSTTSK